ncbi:MAG: amidohydrolase [Desulfobacteraceae bacterium]|nr:amidohydrolase [Desulfobacteraceae bacterium]MBC2756086.1 amidohydrolase [Desulfobacteraceae bacterium]MBC2763757.1 amidohydrolase [ANME-2 cluster archaeon]
MIIDMHYHLDERMETMDRLLAQMDTFQIDKIALIAPMVDPFHVEGVAEKLAHFVRSLLTGFWHRLGLVAYESTVTKSGKFSILGKTYNIDQLPDNDLVSKAIKAHPDKFYGWFFINPAEKNSVAEMETCFETAGWVGVKCHPFWHRYPVSRLDDAAAFCSEKGLPLLIHLGGKKDNGDYRYLPEQHPKLKIIYAHAGVPHYQKLWAYVKSKKNVYTDLSSPYLDEPLRRAAMNAMGPEKCLYGTDGPFGYPANDGLYDHGAIMAEIDRFPISTKQKEGIMGTTFAGLALSKDQMSKI